jgi:hypothetical protein
MKNQNIMFTRSVPKMSKARLFRSVLALGVVALIMQVSLPRAQAYDLSSLNGSYADFNSGLAPVSPGGPHRPVPIDAYLPLYAAGLWTFDGAGGLTTRLVFNFGGGFIFGDNWDLNLTGDLYRQCGRYWHHDFCGDPSPPLRDRRWRKRA